VLERVVRDHPQRSGSLIKLALLKARNGQAAEAIQLARQAVEAAPTDARIRYCYGLVLGQDGQYERAAAQFTEAVAADDAYVEAHAQLGLIRAVMGDMTGAAAALAVAHRMRPEDVRIATQLSLATAAVNQKTDADGTPRPLGVPTLEQRAAHSRLSEIVEEEPEYVDALLSLPTSEMDPTIFGEILAILRHAISRHPEYADLHYYLGRVLARLGHVQEAIEAGETAVQRNPRYTRALILLGRLYGEANRREPGIERLEQAIAAGAAYPDVHYMLGNLYRQQGDTEAAARQYRSALQINADYKPAADALATLAA
jgi:tetratricopeptide (TPR) repeat protein